MENKTKRKEQGELEKLAGMPIEVSISMAGKDYKFEFGAVYRVTYAARSQVYMGFFEHIKYEGRLTGMKIDENKGIFVTILKHGCINLEEADSIVKVLS